jgi:hypothetical protein
MTATDGRGRGTVQSPRGQTEKQGCRFDVAIRSLRTIDPQRPSVAQPLQKTSDGSLSSPTTINPATVKRTTPTTTPTRKPKSIRKIRQRQSRQKIASLVLFPQGQCPSPIEQPLVPPWFLSSPQSQRHPLRKQTLAGSSWCSSKHV